MPIRAVIFDRDGVLTYFDFRPAMVLAESLPGVPLDRLRQRWTTWCASRSAPSTLEAERRYVSGFWADVSDNWSLDTGARDRLLAFDYTAMFRAFDDARPTLTALRDRGLRIGVLSNFPLPGIHASLAAAGLADLIDSAAAAPAIGFSKPAPEAYLHVTRALGVEPGEALLVDDEIANVAGARAIGMRALLLQRGAERGMDSMIVSDLGSVITALEEH